MAVHGLHNAVFRRCSRSFMNKAGQDSNGQECPVQKYQCIVCNYVYDPALGDIERGIPPGTAFEDLPVDWVCPVCGAGKDMFEQLQ